MSTELPKSAQVAIVGGGIIGLSSAFHLAERGVTSVVVLDRGLLADGTTPMAAGQTLSLADPDSPIAPFRRYCNEFFDTYQERIGFPLDYAQPGALHVAAAPQFRTAVAEEWRHGGEPMTAAEAREMVPNLDLPEESSVLYVDRDGWVDPREFATGLAAAARRLGVRYFTETEVTEIEPSATGVELITATGNSLSVESVAICTGAWTRRLVPKLGVEIPVISVRHQFATTIPLPGARPGMPLIRLIDDQVYVRPHHGGIAYGGYGLATGALEPGDFGPDFEMRDLPEAAETVPLLTRTASRWFPELQEAPLTEVSRGLITMTPDHLPLIGSLQGMHNVFVASGCQVSGIAQSPGWGQLVASSIIDQDFRGSSDPLARYAALADPRRFGDTPYTDELQKVGVDAYNRLFWWNLGSDLEPTQAS